MPVGRSIQTAVVALIAACISCIVQVPALHAEEQGTKPLVIVTIAPHAFFTQRIGGAFVDVMTLIPPGASPHSFEPTPRQLAKAARATAAFTCGIEAEEALLPKLASLDTKLQEIDINEGIDLLPSADGEDAGKKDPHVWLSPRLAKEQARNIARGLLRIDAQHAPQYEQNLSGLLSDLDALDRHIGTTLRPCAGGRIYVFHPAFGYFVRDYGLHEVAIAHEGKEPGAERLTRLIDMAKKDRAHSLFVEPQFSKKTAEVMARAVGAKIVVLDPLAENYFTNMKHIAQAMATALKAQRGSR